MQNNHKNILFSVLLTAFTLGLYGCSCSQASKDTHELSPGLYLSELSVDEGDSDVKTVTMQVFLQRDNEDTVAVDWSVSAIDPTGRIATKLAVVDDSTNSEYDVLAENGTLTFLPDSSDIQTIELTIVGDTFYEHDESFLVQLSNATSGANIVEGSVEAVIKNNDPLPVVSMSAEDSELNEEFFKTGATPIASTPVTISLSEVSRVDTIVRFGGSVEPSSPNAVNVMTKFGETAAYRVDYLLMNGEDVIPQTVDVTIPAGASELVLNLDVVDDGIQEKKEQFFLGMTVVSDGFLDTTKDELEFFINDNDSVAVFSVPLNDSGLLQELSSLSSTASQLEVDAKLGRDSQGLAKSVYGEGRAAFDYTRIDANGAEIDPNNPDNADLIVLNTSTSPFTVPWSCVKDNVSGLVWEVKTRGNQGLRSETRDFYWYDPNNETNGGITGSKGASDCSGENSCNTSYYVADMNRLKLCGMTGWRLPTIEELRSLTDYGVVTPDDSLDITENERYLAYDTDFFIGDVLATRFVWSSTTDAGSPSRARALRFHLSVGLREESRLKDSDSLAAIRLVNDSLIRSDLNP